jgi:hypothetical protein
MYLLQVAVGLRWGINSPCHSQISTDPMLSEPQMREVGFLGFRGQQNPIKIAPWILLKTM